MSASQDNFYNRMISPVSPTSRLAEIATPKSPPAHEYLQPRAMTTKGSMRANTDLSQYALLSPKGPKKTSPERRTPSPTQRQNYTMLNGEPIIDQKSM